MSTGITEGMRDAVEDLYNTDRVRIYDEGYDNGRMAGLGRACAYLISDLKQELKGKISDDLLRRKLRKIAEFEELKWGQYRGITNHQIYKTLIHHAGLED